jgi:hypothetical protein
MEPFWFIAAMVMMIPSLKEAGKGEGAEASKKS